MEMNQKIFYNLFWEDEICKSIFSTHKSELLENTVELIITEEKFLAQRIVLTNSKIRKTDKLALQRNDNVNISIGHKLENSIKKYFDNEKIEGFINAKLGKTIKKIENDINSPLSSLKLLVKFFSLVTSEKGLVSMLKEYHLIPEFIIDTNELLEYIEVQAKSQIKNYLAKHNLSEMAISIDILSNYYDYKIKKNLIDATAHSTDVLYSKENYKNRIELFDQLYDNDLIIGGKLKGYYECVECSINTFNGLIQTNLKPSKLKMNCPNCKKELLHIVPYELDKAIYNDIVHKDGLLFFAVQYLLDNNRVLFEVNQSFLKDVEVDIVVYNNRKEILELKELKMFKHNSSEETKIGNLKTAVGKFKTAIDKMIKSETISNNLEHSIITNISDKIILSKARDLVRDDLKKYNITLYSMDEYQSKIKKMN